MDRLARHVLSAGGLGLELPSPEARTDSDNLAKNTGEMGLVAHSAVKCDPRKRLLSVLHDDLGVSYPPCSDVGHGRLTETPSECAREVANAELRDAGEIRNVEAETNVGLDVGDHAFCLPGGEASLRRKRIHLIPFSVRADSQKLRRLLHADFCPIAVAIERGGCHGEELDQRLVAGQAG